MNRGGLFAVLGIAGLATALRLALLLGLGWHPEAFDPDSYHALALEGLAGRPIPNDFHPAGYPWFLAAVYEIAGVRPRVVLAVHAVLSGLVVAGVGEAARRRFGAPAGAVAALLLAASGYLSLLSNALISETLCLALVGAVVFFLARKAESPSPAAVLTAALAVGAGALVRTSLLSLAPVVAAAALGAFGGRRPVRSRMLLAAGALALAIGPLLGDSLLRAERNGFFRFGSAYDEINFWIGNDDLATGRMEHRPELRPGGELRDLPIEERARIVGPRARRWALSHPGEELVLVGKRASYLFAPAKRDLVYLYGHGWAGERPRRVVVGFWVWSAVSVLVLLFLALAGIADGTDDASVRLALALVAFGALPYLASLGDARYLAPLHPALALLGGGALAKRAGRPGRIRLALCGAAAVALALNSAYDLAKSVPALRAVAAPGGSRLAPPYNFSR